MTLQQSRREETLSAWWDVMLRGVKINGDEAARLGITESAHDSAESALEAACTWGIKQLAQRKWNDEVYTEIRKSMYPNLCVVLEVCKGIITLTSQGFEKKKIFSIFSINF